MTIRRLVIGREVSWFVNTALAGVRQALLLFNRSITDMYISVIKRLNSKMACHTGGRCWDAGLISLWSPQRNARRDG